MKNKELNNFINEHYIERLDIQKYKKKLENERFILIKNKSDRVYDNYAKDEIIRKINIKLETVEEILKGV